MRAVNEAKNPAPASVGDLCKELVLLRKEMTLLRKELESTREATERKIRERAAGAYEFSDEAEDPKQCSWCHRSSDTTPTRKTNDATKKSRAFYQCLGEKVDCNKAADEWTRRKRNGK